MPLIDLKTTLKSLKFGNDQPGYGSSGLPYIQTVIPGSLGSPGLFNPIFRPGSTGNLDFPIRGGDFPTVVDLSFRSGFSTYTLSSQLDRTRIRKFFKDAPRGTAFIQKQIGLQLSNPKIETGNTLFGLGQSAPIPGLLENTRVYNGGLNTLAQVGVMGSGAHAVRHGLVPFAPFQKNYFSIVNHQNIIGNTEGSQENRLVILRNLKMTNSRDPITNPNNVINFEKVNTLGISLNKNLLFQYLGGPGSVYGIGNTTIKRTVDTTRLGTNNPRTMTYDLLMAQKSQKGVILDGQQAELKDFRQALLENNKNLIRFKEFKKTWTKEQSTQYKFFDPATGADRMNVAPAFSFINDNAPWTAPENDKGDYNDLIKFAFELINNDNPAESTALFFRAFLTAGISDNNSSQLNSFKYIGRGENFYTYQGFERSITFGFRIVAQSESELMPLYRKLNLLIGQVYPDYASKSGIMRAPLVKVTIGDYLYRMPGFIENVNISIPNDSSWEITHDDTTYSGLTSDVAQLPHYLDVNVSFKPISDTLPNRYGIHILNNKPPKAETSNEDIKVSSNEINPNELLGGSTLFLSNFEKQLKFPGRFNQNSQNLLNKNTTNNKFTPAGLPKLNTTRNNSIPTNLQNTLNTNSRG